MKRAFSEATLQAYLELDLYKTYTLTAIISMLSLSYPTQTDLTKWLNKQA